MESSAHQFGVVGRRRVHVVAGEVDDGACRHTAAQPQQVTEGARKSHDHRAIGLPGQRVPGVVLRPSAVRACSGGGCAVVCSIRLRGVRRVARSGG